MPFPMLLAALIPAELIILPAALEALGLIAATMAGIAAGQELRRLREAREVLRSDLASPEGQAAANLTADQAYAVDQVVDARYAATIATRLPPYTYPSFASESAANDWGSVALQLRADGTITADQAQLCYAWRDQEISRLRTPAAQSGAWAGYPGAPASAFTAGWLPLQNRWMNQAEASSAGLTWPPTAAAGTTPEVATPPEVIVNVDTEAIGRAISDALGGLGGTLSQVLPLAATAGMSLVLSQAENLGNSMHRGSLKSQATAGQRMMELLTSVGGPLATVAILESPGIKAAITDPISGWVFDTMIDGVTSEGHIRPEDAPAVARKLFETAMGLGLAAHAASVAAEAFTPLKSMGVGYLAAFAADMAGFSRIAGATMGVLETRALALPIGYYVNSKVRSALPNTRDAQQLLGERQISPSQFAQLLAYNGIAPEYASGYEHIAYRPPAPRLLQQMADAGLYDEPYYRHALESSAYDDATIAQVLAMLKRRALAEAKTVGVGSAMALFKEGYSTEAQLTADLGVLGVSPELLPRYLYTARLQERYDRLADTKTVLREAVRRGVITSQDMLEELVAQGVQPGRAALMADLEELRLVGKKKAG